MFVKYLHFDDFSLPGTTPPLIPGGAYFDPTWDMVEKAIRSLDQAKNRSLATIANQQAYFNDGGCCLGIGGGTADGKYVCNVYLDGFECKLMDLSQPKGRYRDIVFGQPVETPEQYCVPLEMILTAAREFYKTGLLSKELIWSELK